MEQGIENVQIVIHDKLEPPILRKTSTDIFWDRYSYYDQKSNTIHLLSADVFHESMLVFQKSRIQCEEKIHPVLRRLSRWSLWRMAAGSVSAIGGAFGLQFLSVPFAPLILSFVGLFVWPFTYFLLRGTPVGCGARMARKYLKNPVASC